MGGFRTPLFHPPRPRLTFLFVSYSRKVESAIQKQIFTIIFVLTEQKIVAFSNFDDYVRVQQPSFLSVCLCQTSLFFLSSLLVFWRRRMMLVSSSLHWKKTLNRKTFCKDACKEILTGRYWFPNFWLFWASRWNGKKVLTINWLTSAANGSYTRFEHLFWKPNGVNKGTTAVVRFEGANETMGCQ